MLQRDDSQILWLEGEIDLGRGGDIAVILYTSGTTDRPKVVLTNSGNIWAAHAAKLFDSLTEKEGFSPICRWHGSAITCSPTLNGWSSAIASTARKAAIQIVENRAGDQPHLCLRPAARLLKTC